jgi:putative acetyltransferase
MQHAIAPEAPEHNAAIRTLLLAAFPTAVEADLVDRLRADGDAEISLVAVEGGAVVGHVLLSPMIAPMKALGLGPVAVAPDRQRQGIGSHLVREGIERARAAGWEAVFVLGEPAYYNRFGFDTDAAAGFASAYAGPYFMALWLGGGPNPTRAGRVDYARAFQALA